MKEKTYNILIVITEIILWGMIWFGIMTAENFLSMRGAIEEKPVDITEVLKHLDYLKDRK